MSKRLTHAEISALAGATAHAGVEDIDCKFGPEATAEFKEDLATYLSRFAARKRNEDGTFAEGNPCVGCGNQLQGSLVQQFFAEGGFEWGLVHGHGRCKCCGWPSTAYHFVKDRNGDELVTFRHVVLQDHPQYITVKEPK